MNWLRPVFLPLFTSPSSFFCKGAQKGKLLGKVGKRETERERGEVGGGGGRSILRERERERERERIR